MSKQNRLDTILEAVASLVKDEGKTIFTREEIRQKANIDKKRWDNSYTQGFQGMRADEPGGAPKVAEKYKNLFENTGKRGEHRLTAKGQQFIENLRDMARSQPLKFVTGKVYKRTDLHARYRGQQRGGISTPADHKLIFIFTGDTGEQYGYSDGWTDDNIFLYTGEGQVGDMELTRGNNAIVDHEADSKDIHLFKYVKKGFVRYIGQVVCIGYHHRQSPDVNRNMRQAIIFELIPFDDDDTATNDINIPDLLRKTHSLDTLRQKAVADSAQKRTPKERKASYRYRSRAIKLYVLKRADGVCEGCGKPAPFMTISGKPYLEVHHIDRLSDGGADHPEAVVGICPNCHSRAHYAIDATAFNEALRAIAMRREHELSGH